MPVKIAKPGAPLSFPLTSPPANHSEYIDKEWIAKELKFFDRNISVSYPFPDKIRLVADLGNNDQVVPNQSGVSAHKIGKEIDQNMLQHLEAFPAVPELGITALKLFNNNMIEVSLSDEEGHLAWVKAKRNKGQKDMFGSWRFEISFNPFSVSKNRIPNLIEKFEMAFGHIEFVKLISHARVTRVDCAIDCFGARPLDLVIRCPKIGKTNIWNEQNGQPATIYLYAQKEPPQNPPKHGSYKPHGKLIATIYNRTEAAKWKCAPPIAGKAPVTRLEVCRVWKSNQPNLTEVPLIKNMLQDIGAGYGSPENLVSSPAWRQVALERFPARKKWSSLTTPVSKSVKLNELYDNFSTDLVCADDWQYWHKGLELTGLADLIEKIP